MIEKGRETAFGQFGQRSVEFLMIGVYFRLNSYVWKALTELCPA
jgi:hypothetical protein